ncbi:BA75_03059T0 [Komagataella pastoris]|uniref:BA75_03059T0 n=1 Tax=Komagataella pastoris TaxID=4922 RepID=A0A1B2JAA1_PICPA|nr:BA75_03059T0 [Komagataella pastoris]
MSETKAEQTVVEQFHMPQPFWPTTKTKEGEYVPKDSIKEASKVFIGSGVLLGGMHFRRLMQYKKGSARPGLAKYLNLFSLSKSQLIGFPVALGAFSFLSHSFANLQEEQTATGEFAASSIASLIGLSIFRTKKPLSSNVAIAVGVGSLFGFLTWAGNFNLGDNSYRAALEAGNGNEGGFDNKVIKTERQGFWEGVYRRPLSQTVEDLGEGRGIITQ